jgi:uncharacterized protein YeaO (DUF488 family)
MARRAGPHIDLRRVYDGVAGVAGARFLVDRVWPRGIARAALEPVTWLKDAAPQTPLRKWFGHDPAKWPEFQRRYRSQLTHDPDAWRPLLEAAQSGPVVLLYGARDTAHNQAVALRDFILEQLHAQAHKP